MMNLKVVNHTRSLAKPLRVKNCESFGCRLRGLMFRRNLDDEQGLLLIHGAESRANAAIHMFFVRFDLGVVWLNEDKSVVDIQMAESWHPLYTPQFPAKFVLEIHPDRLAEFQIGDKLSFE
jgi:uncharacterized membrane protein (UPF0127 family)